MANAGQVGMKSDQRLKVLVAGNRSFSPVPFKIRGLQLQQVDGDLRELDDFTLASSCGILIAEKPGHYRELSAVNGVLDRATNLGLMIAYLVSDRASEGWASGFQKQNQKTNNKIKLIQWFHYSKNIEWLAELLRRHIPGPGLGNSRVKLVDRSDSVDDLDNLLLRRAFSDASELVIERLISGKSAQGVYRISATLAGTERGPQPMPFVLKIGTPDKIRQERTNYHDWAEPFIPFHLRPGFDRDRSIETPTRSALVCNFVDGAISLESALMNRTGTGFVFSLFETTLRGLRAHTLATAPTPNAIRDFIKERVKSKRFAKCPNLEKRSALAKELGLQGDVERLEADLIETAEGVQARRGIYHGDLHVKNIMVRQRDAIVIDFESMGEQGPITADPCLLEASLVFGTREGDSLKNWKEWKGFVDKLYEDPWEPPLPTVDHFSFAWLNNTVRELRHVVHCCGVNSKEHLLVLSASLLRYARFTNDHAGKRHFKIAERRQAYAIVVAQNLLNRAQRIV